MPRPRFEGIGLTMGKVALVDAEDVPLTEGYLWYAVNSERRPGRHPRWYAAGRLKGTSERLVFLHRLISGASRGQKVDHWNGNGLDNRRENLRIARSFQNSGNQASRRPGQFKGVHRNPGNGRRPFWSQVEHAGLVQRFGGFPSAEEAARAYDDAARKIWGSFGTYNFPHPGERSALTGEIVPDAEEVTRAAS